MQLIAKEIITEEGEDKFQIRLNKDEGVGLLTTASEKSYLILDSIDYWYDIIQNKYPAKTKCKCKNEWFNLRFEYIPRKGTDDIKQVNIISICTACNVQKKQTSIEIKYSPTAELIDNPIVFCERPNIKYNSREITCYWAQADLKKFLDYMSTVLMVDIYCWFWQNSDNKRHFAKVNLDKANEIITVNHQYLTFYFSKIAPDFETEPVEGGVFMEDDQWRRQEVIALRAPLMISFGEGRKGLIFYIRFSTQYIEHGAVVEKSNDFKLLTDQAAAWFSKNYINIRGKDCYDNVEEHNRIFGDQFSKKQPKNQL